MLVSQKAAAAVVVVELRLSAALITNQRRYKAMTGKIEQEFNV